MKRRIAIVFGATGLIGEELLELLRHHDEYESVWAVVRKELNLPGGVKPFRFDYTNWNPVEQMLGEHTDVYCCIGTTRAKTPDLEEYRAIDYGIPLKLAELCRKHHNRALLIVSAKGANAGSSNFYNKIKGEMERDVKASGARVYLFQPSLLLGKRKEVRRAESTFQTVFKVLAPLIPRSWRAVHAAQVAASMLKTAAELPEKVTIDNAQMITGR